MPGVPPRGCARRSKEEITMLVCDEYTAPIAGIDDQPLCRCAHCQSQGWFDQHDDCLHWKEDPK